MHINHKYLFQVLHIFCAIQNNLSLNVNLFFSSSVYLKALVPYHIYISIEIRIMVMFYVFTKGVSFKTHLHR